MRLILLKNPNLKRRGNIMTLADKAVKLFNKSGGNYRKIKPPKDLIRAFIPGIDLDVVYKLQKKKEKHQDRQNETVKK